MIVGSKKFGRQNSAYRHQIMKGASETERLSLFCKAHKNVPVENHLITQICPRRCHILCSQSSNSSSRQRGFARKRRLQAAICSGGALARARIQLATSTSSAPVEIKSRNAAGSRPVAAKNRRSIGQL